MKPGVVIAIVLAVALLLAATLLLGTWRARLLRQLYALADRQQSALRAVRDELDAAHTALLEVATPDEAPAEAPIAQALRALLANRLWLRDRAAHAAPRELRRMRADWRRDLARLQAQAARLAAARAAVATARARFPAQPHR